MQSGSTRPRGVFDLETKAERLRTLDEEASAPDFWSDQRAAQGVLRTAEGLRDEGHRPIGREGGASAHWLLLDYGSVIVHVMAQPEREYYGLEKLWSEAPLLLRVL